MKASLKISKIREKYNSRNYRMDEFKESDHPRAKDGKFTSGGAGTGSEEIDGLKNYMLDYARSQLASGANYTVSEKDFDNNEKAVLNSLNKIKGFCDDIEEIKKKKKKNPDINYHGESERKRDIESEMNYIKRSMDEFERDGYDYEAKVFKKAYEIAKKITKDK